MLGTKIRGDPGRDQWYGKMGRDQGSGWVMEMMEGKVRYQGYVITFARYEVYMSLNQGNDRMETGSFTLRLLSWKLEYPESADPSVRRRLTRPMLWEPLSRLQVSPRASASFGATQTINEGPQYLPWGKGIKPLAEHTCFFLRQKWFVSLVFLTVSLSLHFATFFIRLPRVRTSYEFIH